MSTINTSAIDVNYPVPGQNNSTQQFRNNSASIKQNLDIAASEITDLQTKAVLKAALANTTIDNNMANTLISNASVLQFRNTMYNLGNALVDNVLVNCVLGDVQYGTLAGNINLDFGSWIPTNTWGGVEIHLSRPDAESDYNIYFPPQAIFDSNLGWKIIENCYNENDTVIVEFPHNVTTLNFKVMSDDCGNTLYVQPLNRPFQSTQVQTRTPPITGQLGDRQATICVDSLTAPQLDITDTYPSTDYLATSNTATLYTGMPVTFSGSNFETGIVLGSVYYVSNIANTTHFTISNYANAQGNVTLAGGTGNFQLNPVSYMYVAVDNYNSNSYSKNIASTTASNTITVSSSMANIAVNYPVIFTGAGASNANIELETVYYIKSISGQDVTISRTLDNGIAGPTYENIATFLTTTTYPIDMMVYDGQDIFRKIPLLPGTAVASSLNAANTSNVRIGGGTNGYFLQTDGTGNLAWVAGGGSGNGTVGGSNQQVQFNNAGSFDGSSVLTFNTANSTLQINGGNIYVSQNITGGIVTAVGNLTGSNLVASGNANIAGSANIAVDANIAGNLNLTGVLTAANVANVTGNIKSAANVISGAFFISSAEDGIAATGTTQTDAYQLIYSLNLVDTTLPGTGVKLPAAITGARVVVRNADGANSLNVYPYANEQINNYGTNVAIILNTDNSVEFFCTNASSKTWYTL